MSELLAIGVSHKTAPVEVRERLALPEARAGGFVRDLRGAAEVQGRFEVIRQLGERGVIGRCGIGRAGTSL